MHRTTTTATLLVTVAVSALTGCVTVQRPPVAGSPAAPSRLSAPRPDGRAEPPVVQAPAREALEMIGPSRRPEPVKPAPHAPARLPAARPPSAGSHPHPRPPHPEPRHSQRPRAEIPDVSDSFRGNAPRNTDVCSLGNRYGGWRQDSPEAVACRQVYGR